MTKEEFNKARVAVKQLYGPLFEYLRGKRKEK
jgi:hypothetical protein